LAQDHEVSVACLADGSGDLANADSLRPLVHAVEAVPLSVPRARLRALTALMSSGRPLTVAYFDEPELRNRVRHRIKSGKTDAVVVFSSGVAQFVEEFADLPRIIQFADLDSQKWRLYAEVTRPPKSWVYRTEANRMLSYERHLAATFTRSLVCSPRERDDFRKLIPEASIECLPNGVDLTMYQPVPAINKLPNSLIFTGVMNYRPNVDGMVWFCRQILPHIRLEVPNVTLTICGSSPDKSVQALAHEPGVTVTGAVPDVRPYMAKSAVAVVPLRIARGIQNKLLEAMAMGLPSVATKAVLDGIDAEAGRDLLVADEPAEFAAAVVRLLRDRRLRDEIGNAARAVVETNYRWERTLNRLNRLIDETAGTSSVGKNTTAYKELIGV
jgi:sugar transferase (PEP-CTERM/EpsH1 system associated)